MKTILEFDNNVQADRAALKQYQKMDRVMSALDTFELWLNSLDNGEGLDPEEVKYQFRDEFEGLL